MSRPGPWRDGRVHVVEEQCSTCVFRPGNLMHLTPGRLKDLLDVNLERDSALTCHATLPEWDGDALPAICRGFFDHPRSNESLALRTARLLDVVAYDPLSE